MISTGRLSPSCNYKSLSTTGLSFSPYKAHLGLAFFPPASSSSSLLTTSFKTSLFLSPIQQTQRTILGFRGVHGQRSRVSRVSARKNQRKGGVELLEMDDSDDEELDLDLLDGSDDELGGDGDDKEDTFVPFGKMKKWLEKKPRGFGEGKEYDISIEEKLLEEMEKSRQAQAENLTKLSDDPENLNSKQDQSKNKNKAEEVVPAGVRVRVLNLPKKKNIHRDLSAAFKLVPGLLSINPAVSGNKKTKDPICKGFAFVHFKSEQDATRFVEMFSSQSVQFGKIQKQIKCEFVDSQALNYEQKKSTDNHTAPRLAVSGLGGSQKAVAELDVSSLDTWEETIPDEYDGSDVELVGPELDDAIDNMQRADSDFDDSSLDTWEETILDEYEGSDVEVVGPELEDAIENLDSTSRSDLNGGDRDSMELRTESESLLAHSSSSKQLLSKSKEEKLPHRKPVVKGKAERSPKKKLTVKEKTVKVPKLTVGGSAKRLKVKEKAVLNDVFSKYGAKATLATKEDS
ncbi:PREDICTED: uncharacterized protein LOC103343591 [Prunus mume]|uniref:Uncharacterized protein LOC103343591 n=1 Tax=Prunus mume TaxID=102107 RepID=A0ABM0PW40_PRUMU|nr:PREDICTED: uncharacterized protein LOC103343591 [Prunus mume]